MKFSIILPVKNGGEYIKECVQSILSQSYPYFNLHILENYSNDGTAEWLQTLKDERVVIIPSDKPLSIEENWARVLSIQKNEFMTLIGHDDLLEPHYFQVMEELIKQHPGASLYQTHFTYVNEQGEFLNNSLPMDEKQYAEEFLAAYMCGIINSTGTGYLMRSKDYDAIGGMNTVYPDLIFADFVLWLQMALINYKATSRSFTFKYRIHNSVSKKTDGDKYQRAFEIFLNFLISQKKNGKIRMVVERYGRQMLMHYCEALAHRILKTPRNQRNITVKEFIEKCINYSEMLIPGQDFQPRKNFRIRIAQTFDDSAVSRSVFKLYKKIMSVPN
jgi:glycosyltransferase involved in cell wall biosynthesis